MYVRKKSEIKKVNASSKENENARACEEKKRGGARKKEKKKGETMRKLTVCYSVWLCNYRGWVYRMTSHRELLSKY